MKYEGRCQPRPEQDKWLQNMGEVEGIKVIRNALLSDVPVQLEQYLSNMHPHADLSDDLVFMCHNSDKKEIMIAKIYTHYHSEKFNTRELCVGEFCKAHVAYLLGNGDKPCILFK
jgi:hypothetical protein